MGEHAPKRPYFPSTTGASDEGALAVGSLSVFPDCEPYGRDWKRSLARPLLAVLEPANQASRGGDAHAPLTRRRTMTEIREGMNVLSADGERLGRIIRIEGDSLLIEKGFFFHKDYACSVNNVREVRGDDVILSLSKIQLETAIGGATEQTTDETRPSTGVRQDVR